MAKERITELGAAEKLYQFRSEQEHFIGDSFDPIMPMESMRQLFITVQQRRLIFH